MTYTVSMQKDELEKTNTAIKNLEEALNLKLTEDEMSVIIEQLVDLARHRIILLCFKANKDMALKSLLLCASKMADDLLNKEDEQK